MFPVSTRRLYLVSALALVGVATGQSFGDIDNSFLTIPIFSFADGSKPTNTPPADPPAVHFSLWNFLGKYVVPLAALAGGSVALRFEKLATAAALAVYFGAQAIMNLYIKEVLSNTVVSEEEGLKGIEASFFMTGLQQMIGFCCFLLFILLTGHKPKKLESARDYGAMLLFSTTFVLNIALNNFSLVLLPLSVNMVIRSCNPLATSATQVLLDRLRGGRSNIPLIDWVLMSIGVGCAALVVWAQSQSSGKEEAASSTLFQGVMVAMLSLASSALNLVLAGCLGEQVKLSPIDTTGYMSPPAVALLLFPTFLFSHATPKWKNMPDMTDWEIITKALSFKPALIVWFLVLGPMAFSYNVLQYRLVHKLSASHVTFAGNFNKFASIILALIFGIDAFPTGAVVVAVFLLGLAGNIGSFTAYSIIKEKRKATAVANTAAASDDIAASFAPSRAETELSKSNNINATSTFEGRQFVSSSSFPAASFDATK